MSTERSGEIPRIVDICRRVVEASEAGIPNSLRNAVRDLIRIELLYPRLKELVIRPVNALPPEKRMVNGKICSGEDIARAIPDVEAFLNEVDKMNEGMFFEINNEGQLLMQDGADVPTDLGCHFVDAKINQTRVVYRTSSGEIHVLSGRELFNLIEEDQSSPSLEPSEAARSIDPKSVLMERGLVRMEREDRWTVSGEFVRLKPRRCGVWVDVAGASTQKGYYGRWFSSKVISRRPHILQDNLDIGSVGVLRVNLNFES